MLGGQVNTGARRTTSAVSRQYTAAQKQALARVFSSKVIRELARQGSSPTLGRLFAELRAVGLQGATVAELFDWTYECLQRSGVRSEYIFKSAILSRVVWGRHSPRTAQFLAEFRVGKCKADAIVLNGTATAYEIKSARDKLDRLQQQVAAYQQVFPNVIVVVDSAHTSKVRDLVSSEIGVSELDHRLYLRCIVPPTPNFQALSSAAIFDAMRLREAQDALAAAGFAIQQVPNTERREYLRQKFLTLNAYDAHRAMVSVLKTSRASSGLTMQLASFPKSLRLAAATTPLSAAERERFLKSMSVRGEDALSWR